MWRLKSSTDDKAEGESPDDGFAAKKVRGIVEMLPGELRVFQPEEKFGTERAPGDSGGYDRPAEWGDEGISEAAAKGEVDGERDDVGEGLEEEVRVEAVAAEVDVEGEGGCEMECGDDGGIIARETLAKNARRVGPPRR